MAFGNFVVRVAPGADKSKWKMEIYKTAREAFRMARAYAQPAPGERKAAGQVCVFDMRKWGAKPVCIEPAVWDSRRKSGTTPRRKTVRSRYTYAPSKTPEYRPGGKMKRLAWDRSGNPVVKLDGYRRRRKGR